MDTIVLYANLFKADTCNSMALANIYVLLVNFCCATYRPCSDNLYNAEYM